RLPAAPLHEDLDPDVGRRRRPARRVVGAGVRDGGLRPRCGAPHRRRTLSDGRGLPALPLLRARRALGRARGHPGPRRPPALQPPGPAIVTAGDPVAAPATVRVGTAGWSYQDWNGVVYPRPRPRGFDPLVMMSELFDTIEINATFYRTPAPS